MITSEYTGETKEETKREEERKGQGNELERRETSMRREEGTVMRKVKKANNN